MGVASIVLSLTQRAHAHLYHCITQSLNNNCARGLILYLPVAETQKISTISSFMFAASVSGGHVLGWTNSPILFDKRTTWAVPRYVFFRKHEGTNLSGKVLYLRAAIGKSHYSCFLFAYMYVSWTSKEEKHWMCPCTHLEAIFWLICRLLAYLLDKNWRSNLKKIASICRRIEASYVLLSFVYWRDFRKATSAAFRSLLKGGGRIAFVQKLEKC